MDTINLGASDLEDGDLSELDSLINDPDVPMEASRVWDLLDKVAARAGSQAG